MSEKQFTNNFIDFKRREIKRRQGNKCDICGHKFNASQLFIHHKIPKSDPDTTNDLSNGVALCADCHAKADWCALHEYDYSVARLLIQNDLGLDS